MLRQLQTSDHRFRPMSAFISAAGPENVDRNTKVRATSGENEYPPAEKPTWISQIKGDALSHSRIKNGAKLFSSLQKASCVKQNQK